MTRPLAAFLATAALLATPTSRAAEPPTKPGPNSATEPMAEQFSIERGARFLDAVSADWTRQRKCGTCHTNYAHMMARPLVKGVDAPELAEVRAGCHQCPGRKSTGGESVQCRDILDTVRRDMVDTRHGG